MSDLPTIIAEFPKNKREIVRVSIENYKGQTVISVRVFYHAGDDAELRPGRSGLSMSIQHVVKLAAALKDAETKAHELRLISPEVGGDG